jgi:hypothetical protein
MSSYARSGATSWGPAQWYVNGNIMEGYDAINADNWKAVKTENSTKYPLDTLRVDTLIRPKTPWWRWTEDSVYGRYDFDELAYAASTFESAADAFETVMDTSGVFPRDHVSKRLVSDAREGTYTYTGSKTGKKGIIDTEEDAEGFYAYPEVAALTDTDKDGMPDEWESANDCNPNEPDNNVLHESGYTMLEMYLDYAMTHKQPMDDGYKPTEEGIQHSAVSIQSTKILREGQLYIQRGAKLYTVTGETVSQ